MREQRGQRQTTPEPKIIEHALARKEGELGIGGAFLVSTGKFTGRSPDDKHIVKTAWTL